VTIVGLSKDLVITGGYNVYPAEVEGFINELPGVAESAVVGLPHPDFGEGVVAVVVPKPGNQLDGAAIVSALKDRIANFKVPKRVFVVNELPRNTMGKVQKNLRQDCRAADPGTDPAAPRAVPDDVRRPRCGSDFHRGVNDATPCACTTLR
jgi:malonyl-CoA/methylmalonyl-CoA synthetase